ncbi:SDR family NAD(P)-dependent oxidoreductase [Aminobacter aminovorans]|jgi:NAD(P)-dependent dehydrogenase (short-subunit alcohol dehydrogenase family)|uniref:NAD(P)-dependent dehydrogenase (Short-subunit alcohol dehydrogenase family) n=1 Tax=Aminobacter aminovorans TaxID=83263 RepID=A0AAC8YVL3_AMIAI|nr:SDR family oxidoreductase [Aminobacter aminovorans]AMS45282.1 short-chain dehydrogenase [Aminobacter aminovorans]MBB3704953.1 NAD(P)-dependent dehydrogenase (short-subunit alcohol dehydrogenase family) [Aminobacter aminovorans]
MPEGQIIVTGASRGIGAAIAVDLARRGYEVASLSRSGDAPAGYGIKCDVSDPASISSAFKAAAGKGPIIGLVNAAGTHTEKPTVDLAVEEFEQTIRLNTTGVLVACQMAHPHLAASGDGLIVNIGSFVDKLAVAQNVAYASSKAAVGAITRCLAAEWADDGIAVVNIAPGYIETDLNREFLAKEKIQQWLRRRTLVGRPGKPDEVARLVGALFAERIGFLTGETIYIDGGHGVNIR